MFYELIAILLLIVCIISLAMGMIPVLAGIVILNVVVFIVIFVATGIKKLTGR